MEGQPMNGAYVGKKESKVACWLRSEAMAHSGLETPSKAQSQKNQGSKREWVIMWNPGVPTFWQESCMSCRWWGRVIPWWRAAGRKQQWPGHSLSTDYMPAVCLCLLFPGSRRDKALDPKPSSATCELGGFLPQFPHLKVKTSHRTHGQKCCINTV